MSFFPSIRVCIRAWAEYRAKLSHGAMAALVLISPGVFVYAQTATPAAMPGSAESSNATSSVAAPAPATAASESIRPALAQVQSAVNSLDMDHWKLSREGKSEIEADADSMRQDISGALPALLDQAKAAPEKLAPQWSVVRNVDALYDVLVRVTTTAHLTGSHADANLLAQAEAQLSDARKNLTAQLVAAAGNQDKEVATLHAQLAAAPAPDAAANAAGKKIVVNNSMVPATHHTVRHHAKPASKPPAAGAAAGPPSGPSQPVWSIPPQ